MRILKDLRADKRGVAAVELGMVLGLVTLAIFGSLQGLADGVNDSYNNTAAQYSDANN